MTKYAILICVLAFWSAESISGQCTNRYPSQDVRAAGDWSELPTWNAIEPKGLMKFDETICGHVVTVGGLRPDTSYKWKVVIGNSWTTNFGCTNNADCVFTSSSNGQVRFIFRYTNNQLSTDFNIESVDYTVNLECADKFSSKIVRAPGDHNVWLVPDDYVIMTLDPSICSYVLSLTGLTPNAEINWKVQIGSSWSESYGCNGGGNCRATAGTSGQVRLRFSPDSNTLSYDLLIGEVNNTVTTTRASTQSSAAATAAATTAAIVTNPIKPCTGSNCPVCTNNFKSKLIRTTGDWTIDAGSTALWLADEPRGLMIYNERICKYELSIVGLQKNFNYKWKITIDNSFKENYGCSGLSGPDCTFKSSSAGSIHFLVNPSTNPPQLTTDLNVGECGDGVCETGESCSYCPEDCGECPPPVCGDGICEETESFVSCPEDCPNELPGCERFNDENCKSGSQIAANEGVEKRRWQTPKPGQKGYLPGFQDNYALVGYADIRYTSTARNEADLCIVATHKNNVVLTYYFDGQGQSNYCKRYTSSQKTFVSLRVTGSDGTKLDIAAVNFIWNAQTLPSRPGDYRSGQKGAVPEMFGWPHKDVEKECELIAKAGYLGVKLFPVHEQLMSHQPFEDAMNPWYFMYQPVSYKLDGRMGSREDLISLINTCRSYGLRVYIDAVLNHMTGAGNDLHDHRNPSAGCTTWGNKTSSAPEDRRSPFYTHAYTYKYNIHSGEPPSNEFPGAALAPDDFHCDRSLGSWSDLFILNNGWLVGLTDINTGKDNVRERQAAYLVELLSLGASGFRIDAAKHIAPEDLSAIFKKVQTKMGGQLPDDFFTWLEILTGGESGLLWSGPSWYGSSFEAILRKDLGSQSEVDKIKMWDGLYPKEPGNNPLSKLRVVVQNDDHDQQNPGSSSRDMGPFGCVLVKGCTANDHRNFETRLFSNPNGVGNNDNDWPIRFILSSYYLTHGPNGIPDGLSQCSLCTTTCASCKESVPYIPAHVPGECAYTGTGYTRVHRDIKIINAMRAWMKLGSITGSDIGLPNCS